MSFLFILWGQSPISHARIPRGNNVLWGTVPHFPGGDSMPSGEELRQLPMSNIAPGAGADLTKADRDHLSRVVRDEQPEPAKVREKKDR